MKELSIEQKAKAYNKAIKLINNIKVYPNSKDFIKL